MDIIKALFTGRLKQPSLEYQISEANKSLKDKCMTYQKGFRNTDFYKGFTFHMNGLGENVDDFNNVE